VDTNGDAVADNWGVGTWGSAKCKVAGNEVLGDSGSQDFCLQSHNWKAVSPSLIEVTWLEFRSMPNRDPYLAFRVENAQMHPAVSISFSAKFKNASQFGFSTVPELTLQTFVSSRVYGNIRE